MSFNAPLAYVVPEATAALAHKVFPKGNLYLTMRDELGSRYYNPDYADLFPRRGQTARAPVQLLLVLVMQFIEGLSDQQAADAVRSRIDGKYALALELDDTGFDASVLSEFRARLLTHHAEQRLLDDLLTLLRERGLLKARGRQRTDSTHVLGAIRSLYRLESIGEALRQALNHLAVLAPDWLRQTMDASWTDRYATRIEQYRLPKEETKRLELALTFAPMGIICLIRSTIPAHHRGCASFPQCRHFARCGFSNAPAPTSPTNRYDCAAKASSHHLRYAFVHRMTLKRAGGPNARQRGLATACI